MTFKQGILLVSRLISLDLFFWMLSELTYLPSRLISLVHYAHEQSVLGPHSYFYTLDAAGVAFLLLRIVLLLAGSVWFYRCGTRIQSFFSTTDSQTLNNV